MLSYRKIILFIIFCCLFVLVFLSIKTFYKIEKKWVIVNNEVIPKTGYKAILKWEEVINKVGEKKICPFNYNTNVKNALECNNEVLTENELEFIKEASSYQILWLDDKIYNYPFISKLLVNWQGYNIDLLRNLSEEKDKEAIEQIMYSLCYGKDSSSKIMKEKAELKSKVSKEHGGGVIFYEVNDLNSKRNDCKKYVYSLRQNTLNNAFKAKEVLDINLNQCRDGLCDEVLSEDEFYDAISKSKYELLWLNNKVLNKTFINHYLKKMLKYTENEIWLLENKEDSKDLYYTTFALCFWKERAMSILLNWDKLSEKKNVTAGNVYIYKESNIDRLEQNCKLRLYGLTEEFMNK